MDRAELVQFQDVLATVLGIADEFLAGGIDDEIEQLEGDLADEDGQSSGSSLTSVGQSRPWIVKRTVQKIWTETWPALVQPVEP